MDYGFFSFFSSSLTSHIPLICRQRLSWIVCSSPADRQPTALRKCKEMMGGPEMKSYTQPRLSQDLVEGGGVTKSARL